MKIKLINIFVFFPLLIFAQKDKFSKFNGTWVDTTSLYNYRVEIKKGFILIETKNKKKQKYYLKYKNGLVWFDQSNFERIELDVYRNETLLRMYYVSLKEKYPTSAPFITTVKFIKSPR
jgi:hypothetical protein